jgi:hypothetical protein
MWGHPHWRQRKRDGEGRPPFTWGLGLCPNFPISYALPQAARKKGKRDFRGHPEAPAGRLVASLHPPQQATNLYVDAKGGTCRGPIHWPVDATT